MMCYLWGYYLVTECLFGNCFIDYVYDWTYYNISFTYGQFTLTTPTRLNSTQLLNCVVGGNWPLRIKKHCGTELNFVPQ